MNKSIGNRILDILIYLYLCTGIFIGLYYIDDMAVTGLKAFRLLITCVFGWFPAVIALLITKL